MRLLVLGAAGMLGHKMLQRLRREYPETWGTVRGAALDDGLAAVPELAGERIIAGANALDIAALEALAEGLRPDVTVNCLGLIKQRREASDVIQAGTINSLLPHRLARTVGRWGGRFVHFSTDCVFTGRRGHYTETDPPDAEDVYGRTKALGEVGYDNALTLRTSIIGRELRHHQSLLDWFLSRRGGTVKGFTRVWWSGVTTNHLADLVVDVLRRWPALSGVYQVSSGRLTKYDLLQMLNEGLDVGVSIAADPSVQCDRSLSGAKLEAAIGYACPPWTTLIAQLKADPTVYPPLA